LQDPSLLVHTKGMKRTFLLTALTGSLMFGAGCTQFPALDRTLTPELEAAAFPALVPLGPVLAGAQQGGIVPQQAAATIEARVAALKSRAAGLRGSILSGAERQRLAQGLQ